MSILPRIVNILKERITQIDFRINLTSLGISRLYTLYMSQARQFLSVGFVSRRFNATCRSVFFLAILDK